MALPPNPALEREWRAEVRRIYHDTPMPCAGWSNYDIVVTITALVDACDGLQVELVGARNTIAAIELDMRLQSQAEQEAEQP